jgi:hypothetical protein
MYNKDAKTESPFKQVLNTLNEYSDKEHAGKINSVDHQELKTLVEKIKLLIEKVNCSPLQKSEIRSHSYGIISSKDRLLYFSGKY